MTFRSHRSKSFKSFAFGLVVEKQPHGFYIVRLGPWIWSWTGKTWDDYMGKMYR